MTENPPCDRCGREVDEDAVWQTGAILCADCDSEMADPANDEAFGDDDACHHGVGFDEHCEDCEAEENYDVV